MVVMVLAVPSTKPSALTLQVKWELFLKASQDLTAAASNIDCIRKSPPSQCGVNNFGRALVPGEVGHLALFQKSLGPEALCASALLIPKSHHSGLIPFSWQPAQQKGRADLFFSSRKDTLLDKVWVMINLGCKYFTLSWGELPPSSKATWSQGNWDQPRVTYFSAPPGIRRTKRKSRRRYRTGEVIPSHQLLPHQVTYLTALSIFSVGRP